MRLRLDLAYDGGGFYGWARQPALRTVQGEMEAALRKILRLQSEEEAKAVQLTVAGRTDTGVHASHQVCHLDLDETVLQRCVGHMNVSETVALERRLRHILPADISLLSVQVAPQGFDARFSALERTYVYRISDGGRPADPRMRGFVLPVEDELDVAAMNEVAAMTIGLHDFGSFATANPGGTTIREVKMARWQRVPCRPALPDGTTDTGVSGNFYTVPSLESGLLYFTIVADAFAHNMVRSLVNACVGVGRHRKSVDWFAEKMANPVREGSTGPIAACALTLEHVAYPPDDRLASRAERIRARRTLPPKE